MAGSKRPRVGRKLVIIAAIAAPAVASAVLATPPASASTQDAPEFGFVTSAVATSIKSIGEGVATVARK